MPLVTDSILDGTKKALGIGYEYVEFDPDIIMHINSVFSTLQQLGVGEDHENSFMILDNTSTWTEFIGTEKNVNAVKSYMYLRVRLLFDPPATSFAQDSMQKQAQELEWRLNVQMEGVRHPFTSLPSVPVIPVIPEVPEVPGVPDDGTTSWSNIFKYRAKTNALPGDPGDGKFQWLDANQIASTQIDISNLTDDSLDVAAGLARVKAGDLIHVQDWSASQNYQNWVVDTITNNLTYYSLGVVFVSASGTGETNFPSNRLLAVQLRTSV